MPVFFVLKAFQACDIMIIHSWSVIHLQVSSTFDETHNVVLRTDLDSSAQDKANDTTPEFSSAVLRTAVSRYSACTAISLAESRDMPNLYRGTTLL